MIRIWGKTGIEELEQNLADVKQTEIKEPEWQTRFRIEYSELKERYNKLHKCWLNTMRERWNLSLLVLLNYYANKKPLWGNI